MKHRNVTSTIILLLVVVISAGCSNAIGPTMRPIYAVVRPVRDDRPDARVKHVLIISIDGLRPDLIFRADMKHVRALMDAGSFTLWAKTTASAITLPAHVSMLTGVIPEVHAILWNADLPFARPVYPASLTLFEVAKRYGYTTALAAGKSKFSVFDRPAFHDQPAALDWKYWPSTSKTTDAEVISHAIDILRVHTPDVMFVHLAECDNVGHGIGWGTPAQLAAAASADACVGQLLNALRELKRDESTLVIVTADHGGAGRAHGTEDARSRTIPWFAVGPGVRKDFDLTRLGGQYDVLTFDTFATACYALGIPLSHRIDGKPIRQIFDSQELLVSNFEPKMAPATMPVEGR